MNKSMTPKYYCSSEIFTNEMSKLKDIPVMAAHECEFTSSFVKLIDLNERSFFLKRSSSGELGCFLNACPHRWARLVDSSFQGKDLICKYHGLDFSKDSCEKKLIKKELFQIGKVVLLGNDTSLKLSNVDLVKEVALISEGFKRHVGQIKLEIAANWKIVVENTLESVHVKYVHPNFPKIETNNKDFRYFEDGSSSWTPKVLDKSPLDRFFYSNSETHGKYSILHLFPLSFISTVNGISSSLVRLNPLKVDKTEIVIDIYVENMKNEKIREAIEHQIYEATKKIFEEDKEVCELAQRGALSLHLENIETTMDLWPSESRIGNFHNFYHQLLMSR